MSIGPCMCGATDCPSCGPAQGYDVVRVWNNKRHRFEWVNPDEDGDIVGDEYEDVPDEPERKETS